MRLFKDTAGDTLSGAIDGTNAVFTARYAFLPESVNVYVNGLLKVRDWADGFTVTAPKTVTLNEAPQVGDSLEIEYQTNMQTGGGALGGVPDSPVVVTPTPTLTTQILRPQILDSEFKKEC